MIGNLQDSNLWPSRVVVSWIEGKLIPKYIQHKLDSNFRTSNIFRLAHMITSDVGRNITASCIKVKGLISG